MSRSILVTGAAGFAASHLLDLLTADAAEPVRVVAWTRPGGRRPKNENRRVEWQSIDILDGQAVREAIVRTRPDAIYHFAGAAHVGHSWANTEDTFAANVRGTHHIVEGLRDAGIAPRVLIPSSAAVYESSSEPIGEDHHLSPASPYALSKLAQELVARGPDGIGASIARAFNHIGPRQDDFFAASAFAKQIAEIEAGHCEPELLVGNLDTRRDLTDVRDTVRAYRLIVEKAAPGRIYNVCSGRAIGIRELLDLLLARSERKITVRTDESRYRPNDVPVVLGDPTRIRTELGWLPSIPLEQTVEDLLEYWRAQVAKEHGR
jgi:GDP-4-dehydro-6-deoxy-D-mannose reductase